MSSNVYIGKELLEKKSVYLHFGDRDLGTVLLGATGKGKTSLMEQMIFDDLASITTALVFDPHGELGERVLRSGADLFDDRLLFCEITGNLSYGFNPLEVQNPGDPLEESQTIDSLMQVFRKHWSDNPAYSFGSRVEWVLSNTARTILANPGYTLAEIPLLLHDKAFRDKLVRNVMNPQVQFFWGEYRQLESTRRPLDTWQMVESTITRLTQFLANEWLYRVLYQAKGTIKFHELIDSGKTIIFSLPIGKLGEEPASLLGSLLLGKLATTIFGRNEYGKQYPRVHIYIDEYARFSIPMISQLWTQARKFNCGLTATIQTLSQIKDEESRAAILQAGNLIAFQCIGSDAEIIAKQMPLPDPVSLMKPEPILLYSQTPVEDIWHKGHPSKTIQQIRELFYWIVGEAEKTPPKDYYRYDWQNRALPQHPQWHVLNDWDWFCSSRDMLKRGIALLNKYFYNWMNHKYSSEKITEDELNLLLEIVECVSGMMGMRPTMQPYISQEQQAFLRKKLEDKAEYIGEKQGLINPRTGEKDWKLKKLEDSISRAIPDVLYPSLLRHTMEMAIAISMSQYEIDRLIDWQARPLSQREADNLRQVIRLFADLTRLQRIYEHKDTLDTQAAYNEYSYILYTLGLGLLSDDDQTFKDVDKREAKYGEIVRDRTYWQVGNLHNFITLGCRFVGSMLEKEPVFDTSHSYKEVEYNRRTYSDLREELVTKLVSLPPYQAIVHLASQGGELPVQVLTPLPLPISPDAEAKTQAVREESRRKLGHPWQEVVKDIQTRQNLPPAKPQI